MPAPAFATVVTINASDNVVANGLNANGQVTGSAPADASPNGDVLLGEVQDSLVRQTGFVERIQLT